MEIYLSEDMFPPKLDDPEVQKQRVFDQENIKIGDWKEGRSVSVDVPLPEGVKNNGTFWAHVFVGRHGQELNPWSPDYKPGEAYYFTKLLTRYMPKKKVVKTKKLIGGTEEDKEEEPEPEVPEPKTQPIVSYWHSNFTLDMVADNGVLQYSALPPPLRQHVVLEQSGARDKSGQNGWYYPVIFTNEFWLLKDHMIELNNTVSYVSAPPRNSISIC